MRKRTVLGTEIEESSGNVFADLGLPDAVELHTKVGLGMAINRRLTTLRLTQVELAKKLSISQPKVSALKRDRLEGFSVQRLMEFLAALGSDVDICIQPPQRTPGKVRVVFAPGLFDTVSRRATELESAKVRAVPAKEVSRKGRAPLK